MSTVENPVGDAVTGAAYAINPALGAATVVGRDAISMLIDRARAVNNSDSLVSFTQAARVEPLVLVDTDAVLVEELHDVLQSLQSIFAGYYLQAIALDSTLGNLKVMETLGKFNPGGSPVAHKSGQRDMSAFMDRSMATIGAMENYTDALPDWRMIDERVAMEAMDDFGNETHGKNGRKVESQFDSDKDYKNWKQEREVERNGQQEADRVAQKHRQTAQDHRQAQQDAERTADRADQKARQKKEDDAAAAKKVEDARNVSMHIGDGALKDIRDASNLSVGKMIDVEIKNNGQTFQVPVAIRLVVNTIPSAKLVHILSLNAYQLHSASDRWHGYKSGRLSFVKDLIFCRDLIDEHRRSLMASSDSVYHNVIKREKQALAAAFISGVPSVAAASNMVVTTTNTIEELEVGMPGKFSEFKARQKIFERTSLMIVAVIDKEWSRVTFYHRGLPEATEVSFRDLKTKAGGNGPDVSDILKAYTLGQAPRL